MSNPFNILLNRLMLGRKGRQMLTSFEELNQQAADVYARAAVLFDHAAAQAWAADAQEALEIAGPVDDNGPTSEDLMRESEATFALAEMADALGDEVSEAALMHFEHLERHIGPKRAAHI